MISSSKLLTITGAWMVLSAGPVAVLLVDGCAAQKPACQIIKLADEACVMIEGKDGVRVKVPAAELHRVALEAQLRLDASASPSASASPISR